jgi:multiple sugar transport system substrate-binding protein
MYSGTIGLFFNKSVFQRKGVAPPDATWDWARYRDAAMRIQDKERRPSDSSNQGEPGAFVYGRRQVRGYDRVMQRIHQAGANYVDPKDDRTCVLNTPAALQALEYERDANLKDKYTGIEPEYEWTKGMDYFRAISAQRWGMWEEGSFALVRFTTQVERDVLGQLDVAPLPKGPKQKATLATNDGWSIWKGSKATDETWELMKFLMTDEWNEIASRDGGQQSGRKSFQDRWEKLIKEANPKLANKNLAPFKEAITKNEAKPIELFRKHVDALAHVNTLVINGSIRDGKTNVDAAAKEAAQLIAALHK